MAPAQQEGERVRILLAEDHVVVRDGIRELLTREPNMEVVGEAGDGATAVELAMKLEPDVVIMDVAMPVMNGIEAAKRIKQALPNSAILVLTAHDYDEFVFALLEAGAAGYLLKSVSGEELVNAVRSVYLGEQVLHPVVLRKLMGRVSGGTAVERGSLPAEPLSDRELEVLRSASRGKSNKEIAKELHISDRTVQAHLRTIFNKLAVGSRSEAVMYGLKRGWLALEELP